MLDQLDKILELSQTILTLLGSPVILGILALVYQRITKKKADEEKIKHFFNNILTTVKTVEKDLGLDANNAEQAELDPRMSKALELFAEMKEEPAISKALKNLHIGSEIVDDVEEIKDLLEKLLHAKKIAMDFDVVKEIEVKKEHKKNGNGTVKKN